MLFIYFLIEIDFLGTRSYFPPAIQNAPQTTHNQSKFVVSAGYSHLHTPVGQWKSADYPNYFINLKTSHLNRI